MTFYDMFYFTRQINYLLVKFTYILRLLFFKLLKTLRFIHVLLNSLKLFLFWRFHFTFTWNVLISSFFTLWRGNNMRTKRWSILINRSMFLFPFYCAVFRWYLVIWDFIVRVNIIMIFSSFNLFINLLLSQ